VAHRWWTSKPSFFQSRASHDPDRQGRVRCQTLPAHARLWDSSPPGFRCRSAINPGVILKSTNKPPLNGPQKELFADGTLSGEGNFENGNRNGQWTFYYKSGGRKAFGTYADGELDGYWEWWRENAKPLQAGAFDHGKQVGPWKRYYENGQLWDEGGYADGVKVGEWKVYQKTGELKQLKTHKRKK
jgi:antitoxin component YwqK of YwqJK toxin-antitoxin module